MRDLLKQLVRVLLPVFCKQRVGAKGGNPIGTYPNGHERTVDD